MHCLCGSFCVFCAIICLKTYGGSTSKKKTRGFLQLMCILLSFCSAFGGLGFISMKALAMLWIIIDSAVGMPEEAIPNNSMQYKFFRSSSSYLYQALCPN